MGRMQAWSQSGTRRWKWFGHSTSQQLIVSLGESRSAIVGGLLTEATGHSAWLCMDCGNRNTSQRMIMIEILFYYCSNISYMNYYEYPQAVDLVDSPKSATCR